MFLHQLVGRLACQALAHESKHHAFAEKEPASQLQVVVHAFLVDHQAVDQPGRSAHHEICDARGIRADHPLHRRMRNVALVPERHILQGRARVRAQQARQPAQVLRKNRVLLVGHGGRALLSSTECLHRLTHLGSLPVPDGERDTLHRSAQPGQSHEVARVAIARHDLGGNHLRVQTQGAQGANFDLRVQAGVGTDRPSQLAG